MHSGAELSFRKIYDFKLKGVLFKRRRSWNLLETVNGKEYLH
jgi:hypothetical protein